MYGATWNTRAFDRQLRKLSRRDQFAVFGRGLRRGQQSMRKEAVAQTREVLNVKAGAVRDVIKTRPVRRRALKADVRIRSRPLEVYAFARTRQTSRGLSVQIKKTSGRKVIPGGFIATMRSGKTSAFVRRRGRVSGERVGRLPIKILFTSSVRQVLDEKRRLDAILAAGHARFVRETRREIGRRLRSG